ncbi:hypothetical protein G5V58_07080 [Nocardioides anomalus]|uniref:Uncharacterized protein n=1 Tax=Nocardioides anomalus TaxID=2712223 RepID=A0A6G6WBP7_9ACTN|nr:hypothetical protein [Nocardioides anomalus]QIG42573.1 hypothetical protein G5V58_07080 [Nocardioides anomalus]
MNQLATLLREDVAATEPPHGLDARVPVALGRRRLRARRLVAGAAAAAVVAVAAAAVPLALGDEPVAQPSSTQGGWAAHVRAELEPAAGPLPVASTRRQGDATLLGLGPSEGGWHFFTVELRRGDTLTDPAAYCRDRMALGYVSCTPTTGADGRPAVVQELAVVNTGAVQTQRVGRSWDLTFARVPVSELDEVNPDERVFRRQVIATTPTGTVTVTEQLAATSPEKAGFRVPVEDLLAAAVEPGVGAP